jgi:hypothetical protein
MTYSRIPPTCNQWSPSKITGKIWPSQAKNSLRLTCGRSRTNISTLLTPIKTGGLTGYSRGACTPMFIAALFTIAKLWKQPRCPTTDEWIKKIWYTYTMEFYAAMKKNEMLSFAGKWMELENISLSKVSLAQKTKYHMFSLICGH